MGFTSKHEKDKYSCLEMEVINNCIYLGVLFCYNGKFVHKQKKFAEHGYKALFSLINI